MRFLVDVDGVVLDWDGAFNSWMEKRGYVSIRQTRETWAISERYGIESVKAKQLIYEFNNSAAGGRIPPFRDAHIFLAALAEKGHKFDFLTSFSTIPESTESRRANLELAFPNAKQAFGELFTLPCGAPKDNALLQLRYNRYSKEETPPIYIDDSEPNASAGVQLGYTTIYMKPLMFGPGHANKDIKSVATWNEIYLMFEKV